MKHATVFKSSSKNLSWQQRKDARNRAIQILDEQPKISQQKLVEMLGLIAGVEAERIATEAREFRAVVLIAQKHFEATKAKKYFQIGSVDKATQAERDAIGSKLHGSPLTAAFFMGHARYMAAQMQPEPQTVAITSVAVATPMIEPAITEPKKLETDSNDVEFGFCSEFDLELALPNTATVPPPAPSVSQPAVTSNEPKKSIKEMLDEARAKMASTGHDMPRVTVNGRSLATMSQENPWWVLFSAGIGLLKSSPATTEEELLDFLAETKAQRNVEGTVELEKLAVQVIAAHEEFQNFLAESKKFLDANPGTSEVCTVADALKHLIPPQRNEDKEKAKRRKLRIAIRQVLSASGIRWTDAEAKDDPVHASWDVEVERTSSRTGKTERERAAGKLARQEQNRSQRAAINKATPKGPSGGGKQAYQTQRDAQGRKIKK